MKECLRRVKELASSILICSSVTTGVIEKKIFMKSRRYLLPALVLGAALLFLILTGLSPMASRSENAIQVISLSGNQQERANAVAFAPDGKLLAIGTTAGIDFYETSSWTKVGFASTNTWVRSLAFSPDGTMIVAGLFDQTVQLWRVSDFKLLKTFTGHTNWVWGVAFSPDGQSVASASNDGTLRIWPVNGDTASMVISQGAGSIRAVAFSPDGQFVAAGLDNGDVNLWRTSDGSLVRTMTGHTDWVRCIAFSPDGKLLATGGFDTTIRLWNVSDGSLVRTLKGHVASVLSVAFSPDGTLLASGSEDRTIHLWRVSDGSQWQVFKGHTDFVFAVAFSPDGKMVASGSKDNSVRIWPVDASSFVTVTPTPQSVATQQNSYTEQALDCGICHHPKGQVQAPRVFEVRCDTCHNNGIGMNFCPAFPRSPDAKPLTSITYKLPTGLAGVPVNSKNLSALIATPSNGETLYVNGAYTAPAFVTGKITYNSGSPADVNLSLEIWSGSVKMTTLTANPNSDGTFKFDLDLNPSGAIPYTVKPGGPNCIYCHEDYISQASLPNGQVHLILIATGPDGEQVRDERWFNVDVSGSATVPVNVVDDVTGQPVPGLKVQADTVLLEWRSRNESVATNQSGVANFSLEALTQYPTVYKIYVPQTVLNGDLYTSSNPVQLTLPAGATSAPELTIRVHRQIGQIQGMIHNLKNSGLSNLSVWAIALPDGPAYQTAASSSGTFTFQNIPVRQYLIVPDLKSLEAHGYQSTQQTLDLTQKPSAGVSLDISQKTNFIGQVIDQNGTILPFAWLNVDSTNTTQPVNPVSENYVLPDFPNGSYKLTAVAPGFYAATADINPKQNINQYDFQLVPRPETKQVNWGSGSFIVPSDTSAQVNGLTVHLDQGWLWGQGGASRPLDIQMLNAEISIPSGKFALEQLAGQTAWFYLYAGNASVHLLDTSTSVSLSAGQMIALDTGAVPIKMDATLAAAFHPNLDAVPVGQSSQPPLVIRVQGWLMNSGIRVVQGVTFLTYLLAIMVLVVLLIFLIFWITRRKKI